MKHPSPAIFDLSEVSRGSEVLTKSAQEKDAVGSHQEGCQHVDWIEGFHKLTRAIISGSALNLAVKTFMDAAQQVANVRAITVRLRNPATGDLDATACGNLDETEWKSTIPRGAVGLSRAAVESKAAVMVLDIQHQARARHGALLQKYGLVSYLGIPLVIRGEVVGVMGYYSDNPQGFLSDEIQYLQALTDLTTIALRDVQLVEQHAEQAVHLRKVGVTAEKSEKAKSEFLGVMSHEFRTPLNLIMGYAGMMQEGMLGELNEEQKSSLDRILRCSDDLLAMVMSMLEASTIETGAVRLDNQEFHPRDLLEELKAGFSVPPEKDLDLVWNWPRDLPNLKTDRAKLKQVLEHVIDNALKFSDRGQVVISAGCLAHPSTVKFTIADTGVGIAPEAIPFVFEKFRQSDSSMTRSHGGVGLGLYIAKKFIDLLGGEISVSSELGTGSTFTITLPQGL